ncbi:hypothetical protein M8J77_018628 [Diaphorina citri]|nr:hypothetical protein M8J77_018628 [Diaphorina citri]
MECSTLQILEISRTCHSLLFKLNEYDVMNLDPQSKVHKTSVSWCEAENNPVTQLVEDVEITLSWSPQWPVLRTESTWDVHGSTQGNNNVPAKGHHSQ